MLAQALDEALARLACAQASLFGARAAFFAGGRSGGWMQHIRHAKELASKCVRADAAAAGSRVAKGARAW